MNALRDLRPGRADALSTLLLSRARFHLRSNRQETIREAVSDGDRDRDRAYACACVVKGQAPRMVRTPLLQAEWMRPPRQNSSRLHRTHIATGTGTTGAGKVGQAEAADTRRAIQIPAGGCGSVVRAAGVLRTPLQHAERQHGTGKCVATVGTANQRIDCGCRRWRSVRCSSGTD